MGKSYDTHWIGDCVGPSGGMEVVAEKSLLLSGINPSHPDCNLLTILTELPQAHMGGTNGSTHE